MEEFTNNLIQSIVFFVIIIIIKMDFQYLELFVCFQLSDKLDQAHHSVSILFDQVMQSDSISIYAEGLKDQMEENRSVMHELQKQKKILKDLQTEVTALADKNNEQADRDVGNGE